MSDAFTDVVVATDGSKPAEAAEREALALASALGARLHVCYVVDSYSTGQALTDLRARREEAAEHVESVAEHAREAGVDVETAVLEGFPHRELLGYVGDAGADLVVVGTRGRGGARRLLLGSVAEKVIRTADVPVLAIHGADAEREWGAGSRLLVATDGSEAVEAAERVGVDLAAALGGRLEAVSVVDSAGTLSRVGGGTLSEEVIASVNRALDERAAAAVGDVLDRAAAAGVDADSRLLEGRPSEAIRGYAADIDADLVVVGTHGRTGLRRVVLGSVAEGVVRGADRPVLVVPATAGSLEGDETDGEAGSEPDDETGSRSDEA